MRGGLYDFKICSIGNADNKPSVSVSIFLMPCVYNLWDAPEEAVRARVNYYTLVCLSLPSVWTLLSLIIIPHWILLRFFQALCLNISHFICFLRLKKCIPFSFIQFPSDPVKLQGVSTPVVPSSRFRGRRNGYRFLFPRLPSPNRHDSMAC